MLAAASNYKLHHIIKNQCQLNRDHSVKKVFWFFCMVHLKSSPVGNDVIYIKIADYTHNRSIRLIKLNHLTAKIEVHFEFCFKKRLFLYYTHCSQPNQILRCSPGHCCFPEKCPTLGLGACLNDSALERVNLLQTFQMERLFKCIFVLTL